MECPLSYQEILDAYTVNRWDTGQHFCIRVTIPDGSVLLKVSAAYLCNCLLFYFCILCPFPMSCFCCAELNSEITLDKSTAETWHLNQTSELSLAKN